MLVHATGYSLLTTIRLPLIFSEIHAVDVENALCVTLLNAMYCETN